MPTSNSRTRKPKNESVYGYRTLTANNWDSIQSSPMRKKAPKKSVVTSIDTRSRRSVDDNRSVTYKRLSAASTRASKEYATLKSSSSQNKRKSDHKKKSKDETPHRYVERLCRNVPVTLTASPYLATIGDQAIQVDSNVNILKPKKTPKRNKKSFNSMSLSVSRKSAAEVLTQTPLAMKN